MKRVSRQVPVRTEKAASTLPEIGDDNDIGLVISRPGFDPCLPFAHDVGCSEICVPITAPDLQSTELVDQKEVDHAGDRVGAIHRRRAILQDVDVINHWKRNQVNVHAAAESDAVQRTKGDTFAVNQYEGFFGQQAAQIELDRTITAIADVLVDGAACFLRQESCQVRCVADAQFFDVCRTIGIHWVRPNFFSSRNVRAGDDNFLDCNARLATSPLRGRWIFRKRYERGTKEARRYRETHIDVATLLHLLWGNRVPPTRISLARGNRFLHSLTSFVFVGCIRRRDRLIRRPQRALVIQDGVRSGVKGFA